MTPGLIRLICPNLKCRTILSVPISARGKKVRCRSCGQMVVVPPSPKSDIAQPQAETETQPTNNE